ncbi:golvesin C-terminal-like domain-containing protein [Paenibacillus alba]|uniref:Family 16 glycosylhydrolase n=1 Tax=Paenibacillus alba TaxID=1197127 RepID=A0ABU6G3H4_9BACL|nr:family 16 glycosylhydrolase [Paenibacillus alba]MEC0228713.1 family 16 glycosylhydrolase [Paenibacillus alba]
MGKVTRHMGPPHPNYTLVFEDHFEDDELNENAWNYRVGERLGGLNLRENVTLKDSRLVVRFNHEEVNQQMRFTGGGIVTKHLFGYGYYEAKGRLWGISGGLHSSFWSMGIEGDGEITPKSNIVIEIDGYEVDSGKPSSIGMNVHYYVGTHKTVGGVKGTKAYETIDSSVEDFVFGYEWLPNQINWYLNGELVRSLENPKFYGPQNVWLTALGSEVFDHHIDTSCLPGESSWDYFRFYQIDLLGVNLIVNPSFEYNKNKSFSESFIRDLGTPVGWYKEGKTPEAASVHVTDEAYSGECVLRHASSFPFQVTTWVKIPYLPNATYTLSAMVRNPNNGNHCMKVIGIGGEEMILRIPRTEGAQWIKVVIEDIRVTGGECKVAFSSDSEGDCPLEVDDVSFEQYSGKQPHTELAPFPEEEIKAMLPLGEILVDSELPDSGYEELGEWQNSGLPGFVQGSRYAAPLPSNYAKWTPAIPKSGFYKVSFYNVCYENRAEQAIVELSHRGGIESRKICQQGESGWIELGTHHLEQGDYLRITSVSDSKNGSLATATVKFEPVETEALRQMVDRSCLLMADYNRILFEGKFEKLDKQNPDIVPILKDGILMVPMESVAINFGAGTIHMDSGTESVDIFYSDYKIRFKAGSKMMNVLTRDVEMEAEALMYNKHLYVPFTDLAQAFRKKAIVTPVGLAVASDFELTICPERDTQAMLLLSDLFK